MKQEETDSLAGDWSNHETSDLEDTSVKQENGADIEVDSSAHSDAAITQGRYNSLTDNSALSKQALAWKSDEQ